MVFLSILLFLVNLPASQAQVKLSDRKSEAYKDSRKNRKNKQKERTKRYKSTDKRNLSAGEMEVTPEVLKERYDPRDQNAASNPSKQIFSSYQKQGRIFTKKARQALDQGLISRNKLKTRQKNYRKQQRTIANHRGNIRIDPSRMGDNRGMFPQPPVEQNPGRSNTRLRNKKLSGYALKAEEMSMQGLVTAPSKSRADRRNLRQSRKIGLDQGNLSLNKRQKEANYMAKSVEGMNQGMQKRISQRERKQQIMSNSLTQSQFQGQVSLRSSKLRDQGNIEKSVRNQKAGMKYKMNPGQKEAGYMAKSVEGLNQGLRKSVTMREQKQQWMSNSLAQSQFQGNVTARSRKAVEGNVVSKSLRNQRMGMDYKYKPREKENNYMAKSVEALSQGLLIRKNRNHQESQYIRKSKQAQDQGMISSRTVRQKEANYMAKSVEGLNQGLSNRLTMKEQKQQWMANSLTQSQFQGNMVGKSRKEREGNLNNKSLRNQRMGMDYRYDPREKENNYMAKSVEGLNQGLTVRKSRNLEESRYIRKSQEAQDQGMISSRNMRQKEAGYMGKSVEMLSQGLTIRKSRRDLESQYIRKSIESLNTGLISTMTQRQKEANYMGKSVELLNQGMFRARSQQDKESMYIRKSIEASMVGLYRGVTRKEKEQQYIAKSFEALDQGIYRGVTRKEREMNYIQRSLKNQQVGLVKVQSQKAKESEFRDVSREVQNFRGDEKVRNDFLKDWADKRKQSKYVYFAGNFKVRSRLFENLENRRMAARRSKFDGMDQENRFEQWWASLWKKPVDQRKKPEPLRKPRYDSKEHEIWFE